MTSPHSESDSENDKANALDWVEDDSAILILGARRSGKSVLIRELCFHQRTKFPLVIVFTGTKINQWFKDWIPDQCIYEGFSETILLKLIARQKRLIAENNSRPKAEHIDVRVLVIFDDVITEREAQNSRALQALFVSGRHHKISVILASQYVRSKTVPPTVRGNTDTVFIFAQSSEEATNICAEQWLSGCGDKKDGVSLLHRATRERRHQAFVINCRMCAYSHSYDDFCTTHVANPTLPQFRMCSKVFWGASDPLALSAPPRKRWYHTVIAWFMEADDISAETGKPDPDKVTPK